MKSLFSFSSGGGGGGGSGFPGSPVAGVYFADNETINEVCSQIVTTFFSFVFNSDTNTMWFADGVDTMILFYTNPQNFADLPLPTTSGGIIYAVPALSTGSDEVTGVVSYFDGTEWISTGQP